MRAVMNKQVVQIRNPQAIRPWQHVLEPLSGYLLLAEHLYNGNTAMASGWNFGPRDSDVRDVEYIVKELCSLWQNNAKWQIAPDTAKLHEAHYLKLDCSKANLLLDWHAKWNINDTLNKIVAWYQVYTAKGDLYSETINQINQYME